MAMFIRFEGGDPSVKGNSNDPAHRGWIEVLSFAFGRPQRGAPTGRGYGRAPSSVNDLTVSMPSGSYDADIMLAVVRLAHFTRAELDAGITAHGKWQRQMSVTMKDVILTSGSHEGSVLVVSLNAANCTITHRTP